MGPNLKAQILQKFQIRFICTKVNFKLDPQSSLPRTVFTAKGENIRSSQKWPRSIEWDIGVPLPPLAFYTILLIISPTYKRDNGIVYWKYFKDHYLPDEAQGVKGVTQLRRVWRGGGGEEILLENLHVYRIKLPVRPFYTRVT